MIYYLYVKTHNLTGLKYLGKTTYDPDIYKGSGLHWKRHIKKHGYDVSTEIIGMYNSKSVLKEMGLYYSKLWDIVEDKGWANLIEETGDDGGSWKCSEKTRLLMSKRMKLRQMSPLFTFTDHKHTEETKQLMRKPKPFGFGDQLREFRKKYPPHHS